MPVAGQAGGRVDHVVDWANPETEQPLQQAQVETARAQGILVKQQAGISRKQGLREMGYTDENIAAMDAEEEADLVAQKAAAGAEGGDAGGMGKAMIDAFAQGKG